MECLEAHLPSTYLQCRNKFCHLGCQWALNIKRMVAKRSLALFIVLRSHGTIWLLLFVGHVFQTSDFLEVDSNVAFYPIYFICKVDNNSCFNMEQRLLCKRYLLGGLKYVEDITSCSEKTCTELFKCNYIVVLFFLALQIALCFPRPCIVYHIFGGNCWLEYHPDELHYLAPRKVFDMVLAGS